MERIGNSWYRVNCGNVGIGTPTPYKKLTVNGDVSFANYCANCVNPPSNLGDGFSAFEILGNDAVPTRRGISVDNDPHGSLNFYIHTYQNPSAFNFLDGNSGATLMTIDGVTGGVGIRDNLSNAKLDVLGTIRVNDNAIYLRSSTDTYHRLVYDDPTTGGTNGTGGANGPRIFGYNGVAFGTTSTNSYVEQMRITDNCVVINYDGLIPTQQVQGAQPYKLAVNGTVLATEYDVQLRNHWADYVFKNDYGFSFECQKNL